MDGLSLDLVIGLPDICKFFKGVLFHMMNTSGLNLMDELVVLDEKALEQRIQNHGRNQLSLGNQRRTGQFQSQSRLERIL
jgi:hypothetical protein